MLSETIEPPCQPDACVLQHKVFSTMTDLTFRRSPTDGTPVLALLLGEREVVLPLRSLQREFAIADDSDDGRMLAKIAESLDFVAALRIGDRLPAEVLTGDASWEPDPVHVQIAAARLRMQLVDWLNDRTSGETVALNADNLQQVENDPAIRQQVQTALGRAAEALGLAAPEQVVAMIADLAQELAYIEALRDRLLRRIRRMAGKVEQLERSCRGESGRGATLVQIQRLAGIALGQIGQRFDELDAQTAEVMAALRNAERQRAFIRSNRDWLYRSLRGWEPLLAEWDDVDPAENAGLLLLLNRTYQFLALRFMPVTEWLMATMPRRGPKHERQMVW